MEYAAPDSFLDRASILVEVFMKGMTVSRCSGAIKPEGRSGKKIAPARLISDGLRTIYAKKPENPRGKRGGKKILSAG
jgi:hypothetical protein